MHVFLTFLFLVNGFSIHTAPKKATPKQPTKCEAVRDMVINAEIINKDGTKQAFTGTLEKFIALSTRPRASLPAAAAVGEGSLQAPTLTFLQKIQHQNEFEECVRREISKDEVKAYGDLIVLNVNDVFMCSCMQDESAARKTITEEQGSKRNGIKGSMIQDKRKVALAKVKALEAADRAALVTIVLRQLEPEEKLARVVIQDVYDSSLDRLSQIEQAELCPIAMAGLVQANVRVRLLESSLAKTKENVLAGKEMLSEQQEEISKQQVENLNLQARLNILKRKMAYTLRIVKARINSKNDLLGEKNEQLAQLRSDFAQTSALLAAATTDAKDIEARTVAFEEDRDNLNGLFAEACFKRDEALLGRFRVEQRYVSIANAMDDLLQEVTVATSGFIGPRYRQLRNKATAVRRAMEQDPSSFVQ